MDEREFDREAQVFDESDESAEEPIPYKYSITSYGADYPVDSLVKRLDEDVIFVPPFQRSYVWSINRASSFVESLLLGLPVPGIFLSKEQDTGKMLIIDGQQRLKTLQFFYKGIFCGREFRLKDVQSRFEGKTYSTLDTEDRLRLDDSIIHATIVRQEEPSEDQSSIFHIFGRLNTGGMQLQAQEIRACIFYGPFNELLRELNDYKSWRKIYGKPSPRLKDQELILRYFALFFYLDKYVRPIKDFLNRYMGANRSFKLQNVGTLRSNFCEVIDFFAAMLGKRAFRLERVFNAAVYDAAMVGLARRLKSSPLQDRQGFIDKYEALLQDADFNSACKTATSDVANVRKRVELATTAFQALK